MKGWKTWSAAIAGVFTGLGLVVSGFIADPMDIDMVVNGVMAVSASLGLVGIGHKLEKNKARKYVITTKQLKELIEDAKK